MESESRQTNETKDGVNYAREKNKMVSFCVVFKSCNAKPLSVFESLLLVLTLSYNPTEVSEERLLKKRAEW
jgi:hypothetical protein